MSLLLSISGWSVADWAERFRALDPGRTIQIAGEPGTDPALAEYGVAWKPAAGIFTSSPNLKAIFSLGAGVDAILKDSTLPDVPVVRIIDADLTMRMTEWVTLQVLLHHRQQRRLDAAQQRREWLSLSQWAASEVRVGILGLGALGRDSAEVLSRLGFQVAGWSRSPKSIPGIESFSGADGLRAFLARTEILVCLLPLTPDTTGILNYDLFTGLARGDRFGAPVVINAGRGGHQVEADILKALDDGTLSAVSLDVFGTEPLPVENPLWGHPGVTLSPHSAADSEPEPMCRNIMGQIAAFERGEPLRNVVDRNAGY